MSIIRIGIGIREMECPSIANSLVGGLLGFTQPSIYNSSPPQPCMTSYPTRWILSRIPMPVPILSFARSAFAQDSPHHTPHYSLCIVAASISRVHISADCLVHTERLRSVRLVPAFRSSNWEYNTHNDNKGIGRHLQPRSTFQKFIEFMSSNTSIEYGN